MRQQGDDEQQFYYDEVDGTLAQLQGGQLAGMAPSLVSAAAAGQAPRASVGAAGATAVASWAGSQDESDVEVLSAHVAADQAPPHWNVEVFPCGPGSYTAQHMILYMSPKY